MSEDGLRKREDVLVLGEEVFTSASLEEVFAPEEKEAKRGRSLHRGGGRLAVAKEVVATKEGVDGYGASNGEKHI